MRIPSSLRAFIKILFSLAMLAVLFHEIHIKEVLPYLKSINVSLFSTAVFALFIGNLIAIFRWTLIMRTLGAPHAPLFYLRSYFVGLMFNQVLPSSIGGDGYRMIEITKLNITKRLAITSVLADRIIGFTGLIIPALITLPFTQQLLPHKLFLFATLLTVFCTACVIGVYCLRYIRIRFCERYLRWFYDLSHTVATSFESGSDLFFKLLLSILTNFLNTVSFYFIALALGVPCQFVDFIIIIPLVSLIMMLPISMAGWGIREGAMVYFGALIGIAHPASLAISLLSGLILIINSIPGFYYYFIRRDKQHPLHANA